MFGRLVVFMLSLVHSPLGVRPDYARQADDVLRATPSGEANLEPTLNIAS